MPELGELSLSRLCNFVWHMITRNMEEADLARIKNKLWQPPPDVAIPDESPWSAKSESSAFAGLKGAIGGGKKQAASRR